MFPESETPLDQRYLMISNILSKEAIDELNGTLIPESIVSRQKGSHPPNDSDIALAKAYLEREKTANEVTCFTLYAYADIPLGKRFDVSFDARQLGRYSIAPMYLRHVIVSFGVCMDGLGKGHKHYCVFEAPKGVPDIIARTPKSDEATLDWPIGLCDAESWQVLKKIYG
jgi:hypothetical protein